MSVIGHTFSGDNGTIDIVVPPTVKNEGNTYTVTAIGDGAFRGLYATRTVKLSSSIKSIGNDSFYDNYFLEEIEFNEGLESIGTHAFGYNWRMKDIILPSTLRTIGSIAFNSCGQYCEEDHKLILPEDLTIIYDGAFQYCDHITEVYCYAPIPPTFEGSPFTNTNEHATLYVPASFIDSYQNADIWNSFSGGIQTVDHTYTRCITPVISLKDFQVTISSYPGDASIYYTVDGSTPSTDNGILYTEPFFPESDCVIKAIAVKDGLGNSSISQLALDLRVPLPDISMDEDFNITITCSLPDVTIYYIIRTDNGWNTSNDGNGGVADMVVSDLLNAEDVKVYDGSFPMPYFGHVYAVVQKDGWKNYSWDWWGENVVRWYCPPDELYIGAPGFNWDSYGQKFYMSHDDTEVTIYYTLDGSEPVAKETDNCFIYDRSEEGKGIDIDRNCVVKAIAVKAGHLNSSINSYTITGVNSTFKASGLELYFRYIDNNMADEVEVTSGGNYSGDIYIPATIEHLNKTFTVVRIGDYAFHDSDAITSVTIEDGVSEIGSYAFYNCNGLTRVNIPGSVKKVCRQAFGECYYLIDVNLGEGTEELEVQAFFNCERLPTISLPSSLTIIGDECFYSCDWLNEVNIPSGITTLGHRVFAYCYRLSKLHLSEHLTSIGDECFRETALQQPVIPEGVTTIGSLCFYGCGSLVSIQLPSTLTTLREQAFFNCSQLASIIIPEGITTLEYGMFDDDTALATVSLPSSLTTIAGRVFNTCRSLTSITIPVKVTHIDENALTECDNLQTIYMMSETPPAVDNNTFNDAYSRTTIMVPSEEALTAYKGANYWSSFDHIEVTSAQPAQQPTFLLSDYRLTITSLTPGAKIYYSRHGEDVVIDNAHLYTSSIPFTRNDTICAIAVCDGYANSAISYYRVNNFRVPNPVATMDNEFKVTISCDTPQIIEDFPETEIYFSVRHDYWDGDEWKTYTGPIQLTRPSRIRTYALRDGWNTSETPDYDFYSNYYLNQPSPSWNLDTKLLTLSHEDPEVAIYYTLDGTDPSSTNGTLYTEPISIIRNLTVKSVAVKAGKFDSDINTCIITDVNTDFVDNRIYYRLIANSLEDEVEVWNGMAYEGDIVIPEIVTHPSGKKYAVTRISDNAFNNCDGLTSVSIANSVRSIGSYAFYNCDNLTQIDIPSSVETIGLAAFYECHQLHKVTLHEGLKSIEESAFNNCYSLENLQLPSTLQSIGIWTFYNCDGFTNITLPNSLTTLGTNAFRDCHNLKSINIPQRLTKIENETFQSCGLTFIEIPGNIKEIGSYAFNNCTSLVSVELPASLQRLGSGAFYNCVSLPSIEIPEGVKEIESGTFDDCYQLASVSLPTSLTTIGERAFNTCRSLTSITLPANVTTIFSYAFTECSSLNSVYCLATTPPECPYENPFFDIRADLFVPSEALTTYRGGTTWAVFQNIFEIGNIPCQQPTFDFNQDTYQLTIQSLTAGAKIYYCRHNEEPVIDNAHLYTGPIPFMQNDTIRAIAVLEGYDNSQIGVYMRSDFKVPDPLATMSNDYVVTLTCETPNIPDFPETEFYFVLNRYSWSSDGEWKHYDGPVQMREGYWIHVIAKREGWIDSDLRTFDFYSDYVKPEDVVFTIDGIRYTQDRVFFVNEVRVSGHELSGENGTIDIVIPETVRNEGIEYTVVSIGNYAFNNLYAARSLKLPSSLKSIGEQAFNEAYYLEEIEFNEGLESIGNWTFSNNTRLKSITLPSTISYIGNGAFYRFGNEASGEKVVTLPAGIKYIGNEAFRDCNSVKAVYCYATTPPESDGNPFYNTANHATLYVPSSSLDVYSERWNWFEFRDYQGVDHIACLPPSFSYENYRLTMSSQTQGASIYYTTDDSDPATSETRLLYPGTPIPFLKNDTIRAIAVATGFENSVVTEFRKNDFKVERPVTELSDDMVMTISSERPVVEGLPETRYYYNFNGYRNSLEEIIENNDSLYSAPVQLTNPCRVYVVAVRDGWIMSDWNEYNYSDGYTLNAPTIEHSTSGNTASVWMYSTNDNCKIHYTLDGGEPAKNSSQFTENFNVYRNLIVKAVATSPRHFNSGVTVHEINDIDSRFDLAGITYRFIDNTLEKVVEVTQPIDGATYAGTKNIPMTISKDGDSYRVIGIADNAFQGCTELTSVTFPTSVTRIGNNAFDGCSQLAIDFSVWEELLDIGDYAFRGSAIRSLTIPRNNAENQGHSITYLENWESDNYAQSGSTSSYTYTFDVNEGESLSFDWLVSSESGCDWLTITLDGIEIIRVSGEDSGNYSALFSASGSHTLDVYYSKDGSVDSGLDQGKVMNICTGIGLKSLSIGQRAFEGCFALETVNIQRNKFSMDAHSFSDCSQIANVLLNCHAVGSWFSGLSSLKEVILGNNIEEISSSAFFGCSSLKTISIPEGVTEIKNSTFDDCYELSTVTLPSTLTKIGERAFNTCRSLTSITLPASITEIGSNAFSECDLLNSVYSMPATPPTINSSVFEGITSHADLFVRAESMEAYANADFWKDFSNIYEFTNIPCAQPTFEYADYRLTITTQTAGASIYYTSDGTDPTTSSSLYTRPIPFMRNDTIRAIAVLEGFDNSLVTEFRKNDFKVPNPEASISDDYVVTLTCPTPDGLDDFPETKYYYTINRSDWEWNYNNSEWQLYDAPIHLTEANWVHVIAKRDGWIDSDQQNFDYWNGFVKDDLTFTINSINYTHDGKSFVNEVSVTGRSIEGADGTIDISIPERVTNEGISYSVTAIADYAFRQLHATRSVKLPTSIKSIGNEAFYDNYYLEEFEFNEGLESIGYHAFGYNWRLHTIYLPSTLKSIGSLAFNSCGQQSSEDDQVIIIPANVTSIGYSAFQDCSKVTAIYCYATNIPETGDGNPFNGTANHATLYVPVGSLSNYQTADYWKDFSNIQGIGNIACQPPTFIYSNYKLTMSSRTDGATIFYTRDNTDPTTDSQLYDGPISLLQNDTIRAIAVAQGYDKSIVREFRKNDFKVPTPVATISNDFKVTITCETPDIVGFPETKYYYILNRNSWEEWNEWQPYEGPIQLTSAQWIHVRAERDGWENSDYGHFNFYDDYFVNQPNIDFNYNANYSSATVKITLEGASAIYYTLDGSVPTADSNLYTGEFTVNRNVVVKAVAAMTGRINSDVSETTISEINSQLLSNGILYKIADYTIDNELEVIGTNEPLSGDVSIPETVEFQNEDYKVVGVGSGALSNQNMTKITLPQTIRTIANSAFYLCQQLTTVTTSASITRIGDEAFQDCNKLEEYPFNEGLISIANNAFRNTALRSVVLPKKVNRIGCAAFMDCQQLTDIVLPDSLLAIESETFRGCTSLTTLTIPMAIRRIDSNAFRDCRQLTSIVIPEGVERIDNQAFSSCYALASVLLPQTLTSIGYEAFSNCSSLSSIALHANVTSLEGRAFQGCQNLMNVISAALTPPLMNDGNSFDTNTLNLATLFVKEESIEAYQADVEWGKFKNIKLYESLPCEQPTFLYADYTLTISSATPDATIYYTTDGTDPTTASPVCNGSILLMQNDTIRAIAVAQGYDNSVVAVFIKNDFKVPMPTASLNTENMVMTLSCETPDLPNFPHTRFFYTYNNNSSSAGSDWQEYTGPTQLNTPGYVHVRAERDNWIASEVSHTNFYTNYYLAPPIINGNETTSKTVTITHTQNGASIYYSLDGSEPSPSSTLYSGTITLVENTTVKAMATLAAHFNSDTSTKTFKSFTLPTPEISFEGKYCTITCGEPGAAIYYTLDESKPTRESTLYTGEPFALEQQTTVVTAFAVKDNWNDSESFSRTFYADASRQCKAPEIKRDGNTDNVVMSTTTTGAVIYYTINGDNPTANETAYSGPVTMTHNLTIKAIAISPSHFDSDITEFKVDWFKVSPPTISVDGVKVTITCKKAGAKIYYTLDGEEPTETSSLYTDVLTMTRSCTIKAIATYENFTNSDVVTYSYRADDNSCGIPTFTRDGNLVSITADPVEGTTIFYTTDGETPTRASEVYTTPIEVAENCTIKAFATNPELFDSEVATYSVNWFKVEAPIVSLDGIYVTITCSTPNSRIYYTLDGSTPTEESPRYTGTLTMTGSCTIKAIGTRDNFNSSSIVSTSFDKEQNTVGKPQFVREGNFVSITATPAEGTTIYYTLDGIEPTTASELYADKIEMTENCTLKAIAVNPKLFQSDVTSYEVNWFKVETPEITFDGIFVTITCATPNSRLFYTLDGTTPNEESLRYTSTLTMTGSCTVKAIGIRDNFNNSSVVSSAFDKADNTVTTPQFTRDGNMVSISATPAENTIIYYTKDGSEPTENSSVFIESIEMTENCTLHALAKNPKLFPSEMGIYEVSWFKVEKPVMTINGNTLTITCSTPGATIYYAYDAVPTTESEVYTEPITLVDNRTIQAIGIKKNFHNSDVETCTPMLFACDPVTFQFNGTYLTMMANEGATIYYTTDGRTRPTSQSLVYTSPVAVDSLYTFMAIAKKQDFKDSNVTSYKISFVYSGEEAMLDESGTLEELFTLSGGTNNVKALQVKGKVNDADVQFLRSIESLRHLDMTDATLDGGRLADEAFANMPLLSFKSPSQLTYAGEHLFKGCDNLAAIVWQANLLVPQSCLDDIKNPNLLLYVNAPNFAPASFTGNLISGGQAVSITLKDAEVGGNFYCPQEFFASQISYTHQYNQKTESGTTRGWETLSLPFDVQDITHEKNGAMAPFAMEADITQYKPFWLYKLEETGFVRAAEVKAYTPYILSMPNNDSYADDYILAGKVTFSATNVVVEEDQANITTKGSVRFTPSLQNQEASDNVLAINLEDCTDDDGTFYVNGSAFLSGLRSIRPFEAYARIGGGQTKLLIAELLWRDETSIRDVEMKKLKNLGDKRGVFDTSGRKISDGFSTIKDNQNQHERVYIINGKKALVK